MPQHIRNHIRIAGDAAEMYRLGELVNGQNAFDFNRIIPIPKDLEVSSRSTTLKGIEVVEAFLQIHPEFRSDLTAIPEKMEEEFCASINVDKKTWEAGKQGVSNITKYDMPTWFEWCNKYWGITGSAYDIAEVTSPREYEFCTAWAPPVTIIQKLSEMFPTLTITLSWADEDIGKNCAEISYCGGKVIEEVAPANPELFACTIWGLDYTNYLADKENHIPLF